MINILCYIQYVCYNDANGFQVVGYLRCARLFRRAPYDENAADAADLCPPPAKKGKRNDDPKIQLTAASLAEVSQNSHGGCNHGPSTSSSSQREGFMSTAGGRSIGDSEDASKMRTFSSLSSSSQQHTPPSEEEEFVCSIRPADASVPSGSGGQSFNTLLSTASMVAHDRGLLRSSRGDRDIDRDRDDGNTAERRGSPNGSSGSINSSVEGTSDTSLSKKNSTSSETGSDDNGDSESL
jgi:hypothetical protein